MAFTPVYNVDIKHKNSTGVRTPEKKPQKKVSTASQASVTSLSSVTSLASLAPSECDSDYGDNAIGRLALSSIVEGVAYLLLPFVSDVLILLPYQWLVNFGILSMFVWTSFHLIDSVTRKSSWLNSRNIPWGWGYPLERTWNQRPGKEPGIRDHGVPACIQTDRPVRK